MILFLKLLIAHMLGDFVFQPTNWVISKEKKKIKSKKLYWHIGVHAILTALVLQFNPSYLLGFFLIISTHFIIDVSKTYVQTKKNKRHLFFLDQLLHIAILILVTYLYAPFTIDFNRFLSEKNILLIASLLFVSYISSVLIKVIIAQWNPEKNTEKDQSLSKAGRYIGILERLLIFTFILINKWEGIGFLLAAKSIFRFGDLSSAKDRKLTEYILIGTLLSFSLAISIGLLYSYLTN
ncbi:DUF3307 domain-containing protein [Tenacibaculum sp. UWU-22]|uniref:DUF3307 domain-containing protein n=1 Tax=Tenacibaculum sp. UWU-22 TaxID=3234187 RepID=UPI0034DAD392